MPMTSSVTVLVVDDQETVRAQMRMALQAVGAGRVLEAADGHEALAVLGTQRDTVGPVQVMLVDLQMPGMDGIELIRRVAETDHSVVVALVSSAVPRVLRAAAQLSREYGLCLGGSFTKPVHAADLRLLLDRVRGHADEPPRDRSVAAAEALAQGLRRGEIVPYYQPVVDLATSRVMGVEALARWQHPRDGLVMPKDFIGLAEDVGLISRLTEVVADRAMHDIAALDAAGHALHLSLNLSTRSLDRGDLPDIMEARAAATGIATDRITFEVTETRLATNPIALLELSSRLRLKGFRLSIDDFGTGQSTLQQLRRLPFTELKVDASFMQGAIHDPLSRAILESCVDVARRLELRVVAEGIETAGALELAGELGCDAGQGYHMSPPLPAAALADWLAKWQSRPPARITSAGT